MIVFLKYTTPNLKFSAPNFKYTALYLPYTKEKVCFCIGKTHFGQIYEWLKKSLFGIKTMIVVGVMESTGGATVSRRFISILLFLICESAAKTQYGQGF